MEKLCATCLKPLTNKQKKFCSYKCRNKETSAAGGRGKSKQITLVCKQCGTWYSVKQSRKLSKFCSKPCLARNNFTKKPDSGKELVVCKDIGDLFDKLGINA